MGESLVGWLVDSCFVFGRGGGGEEIYGQQFGRQPMNHQDNLVLTRRVMVIPRGLDRMKHGSTCPEHGQINSCTKSIAAHPVNTCSYSVRVVQSIQSWSDLQTIIIGLDSTSR